MPTATVKAEHRVLFVSWSDDEDISPRELIPQSHSAA